MSKTAQVAIGSPLSVSTAACPPPPDLYDPVPRPDRWWTTFATGVLLASSGSTNESDKEQADRRYNELLQELRVAQTGVQFLFAFLLALAFTERFPDITDFQKWLYVATLLATAAASALLIGPVPFHRILFRRGLKPRLVTGSDAMARAGLVMLLLAINGAVLLILDVVLHTALAFGLGAASFLWFVVIWYVVPMRAREDKG